MISALECPTEQTGDGLWSAWKTLIVFVAIAIFIGIRSSNAFIYPSLPFEDGPDQYVYHLMSPSPTSAFRLYAGYASVFQNFCCYLISRLPPPVVPYAMSLYSLLLTSIAYSAFSLKRFRFLVPDDATRAAICVILALMPFEDVTHVSCATYSLWHVLLLLILFTLAPAPTSKPSLAIQASLVGLAVWSHPLSIACVPLSLLLLVLRKSWHDRLLNVWTIAVFVSYYFFGIEQTSSGPRSIWLYAVRAVDYTAHRIIFESVFSDALRYELMYKQYFGVLWAGSALVLIALLGLILAQRERRERTRFLLALIGILAFAYGLTTLSLMARSISGDEWMGLYAHRYFMISKVLFFGYVLALVFSTLHKRIASRELDRFIMTLLLGYVLSLNASDRFLYQASQEEGRRVRQFLSVFKTQLDHKSRNEAL